MKNSPLYRLFEKFLLSPAHFLLFSAYPVMTLFANNVYQVDDLTFVRPLTALLTLSAILGLAFRFILKDWHKAALLALVFLVFLISYGHIVNYLRYVGLDFSVQAFALTWLALLTGTIIVTGLAARRLDAAALAPALNVMAIVLLLFPLAKIIRYKAAENAPFVFATDHNQALHPTSTPDIYYIILDAYTRSDVYKNYGFDNSSFIRELEDMGFYVAQCSQSNYSNTGLSLTSALNLDYIPALSDKFTLDEVELMYV